MIHNYDEDAGYVNLSKSDLDLFVLVKIRVETKCRMCEKTIHKGCFCLGKGYHKYCIDCAPNLLDNAIKSLKSYVSEFKKIKVILAQQNDKIIRNNVANSL